MNHVTRSLILAAWAVSLHAQPLTRQNIRDILGFENSTAGSFPARWSGNVSAGIVADGDSVHSGRLSARIERTAENAEFSTITAAIPYDFSAGTIEWRGFIKTEAVRDAVALWVRLDGPSGTLAFASLQQQQIRGTAGWTEYAVRINGNEAGRQLVFGFLLIGPGKAWVDTLQLLADGKPVAEAPGRAPTILETDKEFDNGSGISFSTLSPQQVSNLARLCKVWGFVKYHHPLVTAGKRHWDYDLFRVLPKVLAAVDASGANAAMLDWLGALGPVPECSNCARLDLSEIHLNPDIDWIQDTAELGAGLSQALQTIHRNRTAGPQFFVELVPGVANPVFEREPGYPAVRLPDAGYQLLALFRFWNMMQYFNPNRDIMADTAAESPSYWRQVLLDSIPAVALTKDRVSYQQELLRFNTKINDTHSNIWSGLAARPPLGACQLPADIRFIEGQPMVIRNTARNAAEQGPLAPGDILMRLGGVPVEDLISQWRPFYAASNEPTRLRDIGNSMTRGACGGVAVTVDRAGQTMELMADRIAPAAIDFSRTPVHDLPGPTFQKLADDVAYLKLSAVRAADSANYVRQAAGSKGLIIDIRNYPSEFVVFTLGSLLVPEPVDFVRFTQADLANPGAFHFRAGARLTPAAPRYEGKIVILVDEVTQSQAEYTTMAFRKAPGALVVGSTTAGADGNISLIPLPGGQSSYISGIGVFYPDKSPTQRIGILPDVEVKPTIEGMRAGNDELIEEAIRLIRN